MISSAISNWTRLYADIAKEIERLSEGGREPLLFRGQPDSSFLLTPSIARSGLRNIVAAETHLYINFVIRAGKLLPPEAVGWSILFIMQHHNLPTRLLDWSDTFSVALYFALKNARKDAAVWVLKPHVLNSLTMRRGSIVNVQELGVTYEDCYINHSVTLPASVVALTPPRYYERVAQQRAAFTLHDDLVQSLDNAHPTAVAKFIIPRKAQAGARQFLAMAGISEYSLFPDLDGLARELRGALTESGLTTHRS